ncbi:MAG: UDP-N-acetylmuramate dehydrogenase [Firmicutes bacterium]|nr:UDP-N-acetylmuramate dehydrogenase [Bacillota bacterium]
MDKQQYAQQLQLLTKAPVLVDAPMSSYTTWKIGGPADLLLQPADTDELAAIMAYLHEHDLPWIAIGNGSNLLVGDKGIRGAVIRTANCLTGTRWLGDTVTAGAGVLLPRLAIEAAERSLGGLAFAGGIPGSIGGAVRMNAGAYGYNIGPLVTAIEVVEYNGHKRTIGAEELTFAYRNSNLFDVPAIVANVTLQLPACPREESLAQIRHYNQQRCLKQPLEFPSCGSVFRNPEGDHAGRLVEVTGLRGLRVGNAQVSVKHGNFIVNLGGATAADVRGVIEEVQQRVYANTGFKLEPEVKMIGEF